MKALRSMVLAALAVPALPLAAQTPSTTVSSRVIECGTDSRQRVLCAAGGEIASARLVGDMSNNRCGPAGSWGWTSNAVWADNGCRGRFAVTYGGGADSAATRRISCGTLSARRDQCSTQGVADTVRLVKEGFFARCREGSNWGYSDSLIWAGNGCRAEFEVVYRRAAPTPLPAPAKPVTRTMYCGKTGGELQTCPISGYVDTVRLVRDQGGTACRQKYNWDYARTFVWARSGCRGLFEVTYRDTVSAPSPETTTRRITCGTSTGAQVTCRTDGHATDVRLVRDLSGTRVCREGTNWGHTDSIIWANQRCRGEFEVSYGGSTPTTPGTRRVTCGSATAVHMQCNLEQEIASARVVRNLGTAECEEGDNWKHFGTRISAGRGCRAEFEVTFGKDTTPGMKPVAPAARVVTCGNASGAAMSCNAFGTVATVRLQRDRSGGRCGQSGSWGLSDQAIWVARGCYGDFALTYAGKLQ